MPIKLSLIPRFDTRGLPEGYDPHYFYEYRYATLVQEATGVERFAYKLMPFALIKSVAFAIDPLAKFKVSVHSITSANRDKYRTIASVLQQRRYSTWRDRQTYTTTPNYRGVFFCDSPYYSYGVLPRTPVTGQLNAQEPLSDYLNDTTSRTRLVGSEQGELQLFKSTMHSPPRKVHRGSVDKAYFEPGAPSPECAAVGGTRMQHNGGWDFEYQEHGPHGATFPRSVHTSLRNSEIALAQSLLTVHGPSLLKRWSPNARSYTLFRNIVELKDIPRSIKSMADSLYNLRALYTSLHTSPNLRKIVFDLKKTSRDIPGEYIAYHFGWKQTYNDLVGLLELPEKMTKKYNFLIKRSGKPTTFRTLTKTVTGSSGVSGFEYNNNEMEHTRSVLSRIDREHEIRLVINATFDFPPINAVTYNSINFLERIGAIPRPTDLYNLIPWTWLIDWFTGLGNYVELIDETNRDPSLINWGMITCRTQGKLTTDFHSKSTIVETTVKPSGTTVNNVLVDHTHSSVLRFECQTRKDVSTILGVKQTSNPSSLTAYQKSILGALLTQRTQHHFRTGGS